MNQVEFLQATDGADPPSLSQFIYLANNDTDVTLLQLDPVYRLPVSKSTFATKAECRAALGAKFIKFSVKLHGHALLGVSLYQQKANYCVVTQLHQMIQHGQCIFGQIKQIENIAFPQQRVLYESKFQPVPRMIGQMFIATGFEDRNYILNESLLCNFKALGVKLPSLVSGSVSQSGFCLRSLAPHFVEIFTAFDARRPVSITTDAFASTQKTFDQKPITDDMQRNDPQFLDIYEQFHVKPAHKMNPVLPDVPNFYFESHLENETIFLLDEISRKLGSASKIKAECDDKQLLKKMVQMVNLAGFECVETGHSIKLTQREQHVEVLRPTSQQLTVVLQPIELNCFSAYQQQLQQQHNIKRKIFALPTTLQVQSITFYGANIQLGHFRVYAGRTIEDLELLLDSRLFLSAASAKNSLTLLIRQITANVIVVDTAVEHPDFLVTGTQVTVEVITKSLELKPPKLTLYRPSQLNAIPPHLALMDPVFHCAESPEGRQQRDRLRLELDQLRAFDEPIYKSFVPQHLWQPPWPYEPGNEQFSLNAPVLMPTKRFAEGRDVFFDHYRNQENVFVTNTYGHCQAFQLIVQKPAHEIFIQNDIQAEIAVTAENCTVVAHGLQGEAFINNQPLQTDVETLCGSLIVIRMARNTQLKWLEFRCKPIHLLQVKHFRVPNYRPAQFQSLVVNNITDIKLKRPTIVKALKFTTTGCIRIIVKQRAEIDEPLLKNALKSSGPQLNETMADGQLFVIDVFEAGIYELRPPPECQRLRIIGGGDVGVFE